MIVIPLSVALAGGILLAALTWDRFGPWCHLPFLVSLHDHPWAFHLVTALALVPLPLIYVWRTRPVVRRLSVVLYLFLGMGLYFARPFTPCLPPSHVGTVAHRVGEAGKEVVLSGVVSGWPEVRARDVRYWLSVDEIREYGRWRPLHGTVLVRAPRVPLYRYGDRVRVVGRLRLPPVFEDFDYRRYLARQGVHAIMTAYQVVPLDAGHGTAFWRFLYAVRERASAVIDATFPEPYAALANGILLGIESAIPRSLYEDFNATGTSHIIVISGFNIAIVTGLFMALFAPWLGKRRASGVAVVGIGLYVLLVGADAAVVRAGIMGGIWALSHMFGRRAYALNSLFASALLMLALNPLTLWDVGFQLSFLATLGLIVIVPLLQSPFARATERWVPKAWRGPVHDLFHEVLLVTLAAQIATTPLIVTTFGRVSLISLLANALILSVQPLIMIGAGISTLVGMVWLPLGKVLALVPLLPLVWTVNVVQVMARWPGAGLTTPEWVRALMPLFYVGWGVYLFGLYRRILRGEPLTPSWGLPLRFRPRGMPLPAYWWRAVILAMLSVPLVVTATTTFTATVRVLPGGDVVMQPNAAIAVFFPAQTERIYPNTPSSMPASLWVLTHTDVLTLARLRLLLQSGRPRLVITPPACVESAPCPDPLRLFLTSLDMGGIPRATMAPGQWGKVGDLRFTYLQAPDAVSGVAPMVVNLDGVEVVLPAGVPLSQQQAVARSLQLEGRTPRILPLPLPERGVWPDPAYLRVLHPSLVLFPEGATYPPASARAVKAYPALRYDPEKGAVLRIVEGTVMTLSAPR